MRKILLSLLLATTVAAPALAAPVIPARPLPAEDLTELPPLRLETVMDGRAPQIPAHLMLLAGFTDRYLPPKSERML